MKQKTITLSLVFLTALAVAWVVVQERREEVLITAGVLLVLMGLSLWLRRNRPFRETVPVFLRSWLLQYLALGNVSYIFEILRDVLPLTDGLKYVIRDMLTDGADLWIGAAILIVMLVFIKKRTHPVLILFTYSGAFLVSNAAAETLTSAWLTYGGEQVLLLFRLVWLASFIRELRGGLKKVPAPSLRLLLLRSLWLAGLLCLFQAGAVSGLNALLSRNEITLALPAVFGLLLLMCENREEEWDAAAGVYESDVLGVLLLAWCAAALVMLWRPEFFQMEILLLGIPAALLLFDYITGFCASEGCKPNAFGKPLSGRGLLLYYGGGVLLSMLALGKTANRTPEYFQVLLALLALRYVCLKWRKKEGARWVMPCFWGIFWMVLAISSTLDFHYPEGSLTKMVAAVFLAAMWCVFCTAGSRIAQSTSSVYQGEYTCVMAVQKSLPSVLAVVTLLVLMMQQ